jgi:hypothetical protein
VPLAASYTSMVTFGRAVQANDVYGIGELMDARNVIMVERGTTVLILTADPWQSNEPFRVRVQGGAWNTQMGYVIRTSVQSK